ncbi:hypothetical protein [Mycolicibacterium poriferae]|uniref:hypothetical protein n=1 Tax=Mycolicibacterium poriferae TaxID=39694 RepID=UPI0024B880E3|nr:hypothetical protein [Mycolicibacterium poriferae]
MSGEKWQNFNPRSSRASRMLYPGQALFPDEAGEIDIKATSEAIAGRLCATDPVLERLGSNWWAQAVAAEIIDQYRESARVLSELGLLSAEDRDRMTRWSSTEDANYFVYPDRRNLKVAAVLYDHPAPVAGLGEYRRVAEHYLGPIVKGCQLGLSVFCRQRSSNRLFALKRGENICVAKACGHCMQVFELPDPESYLARPVGAADARYDPENWPCS